MKMWVLAIWSVMASLEFNQTLIENVILNMADFQSLSWPVYS